MAVGIIYVKLKMPIIFGFSGKLLPEVLLGHNGNEETKQKRNKKQRETHNDAPDQEEKYCQAPDRGAKDCHAQERRKVIRKAKETERRSNQIQGKTGENRACGPAPRPTAEDMARG